MLRDSCRSAPCEPTFQFKLFAACGPRGTTFRLHPSATLSKSLGASSGLNVRYKLMLQLPCRNTPSQRSALRVGLGSRGATPRPNGRFLHLGSSAGLTGRAAVRPFCRQGTQAIFNGLSVRFRRMLRLPCRTTERPLSAFAPIRNALAGPPLKKYGSCCCL